MVQASELCWRDEHCSSRCFLWYFDDDDDDDGGRCHATCWSNISQVSAGMSSDDYVAHSIWFKAKHLMALATKFSLSSLTITLYTWSFYYCFSNDGHLSSGCSVCSPGLWRVSTAYSLPWTQSLWEDQRPCREQHSTCPPWSLAQQVSFMAFCNTTTQQPTVVHI